jgi:alcohol dehydrogenase
MNTKAAVLRRSGDPAATDAVPFDALHLEDVELSLPGAGEVLVDVASASICHSDLSVITGVRPRPLPMVLGHEASGVVREVGPGVRRFSAGDHVLMTFVPACGRCSACTGGTPARCAAGNAANRAGHLLTGRRPFSDASGVPLNHHLGVSAFARQTVVAEESLVQLPTDIPLRDACLFGCAVLTGVGAVVNTARVRPGAKVAVFGLGGVGLSVVLGAVVAGAGQIVAVDTRREQIDHALELGATHGIDADGAVDAIRELTGGGVDFAFEATSIADVLRQAYEATAAGGTAVAIGLSDPAATIRISPTELVAGERGLRGSYMGSTVPHRDVPWLLELHRSGRLPVERLVGARLGLDDVPVAMERLHDGVRGRQIIDVAT